MCDTLRQCCLYLPQRWIFALMSFFAICHAFAMRACLPIAITEMVVPTNVTDEAIMDDTCSADLDVDLDVRSNVNVTAVPRRGGTYEWDEYTQGLILSSFYWGYVITHLPGGMIADRYGGKYTLGIGILLTAIFTILTPSAVHWGGSTALIVLRVLMGFGEGTTIPAINVLLAQWTPPEERSRTGAFVYSGALMGTIYATTTSGHILANGEWPTVFYLIGSVSVAWFVVWVFACYNSPEEHPFISKTEAAFLKERIGASSSSATTAPVPWRHILTSKPLWASIIGLVGYNWSILTIFTDLPKYMAGVLKFSVENNGYLTSLAYFCMWIGSLLSSCLADYLISGRNWSITKVRKIGSVTALTVSAAFVLSASYAGCDRVLVVGMLTLGLLFMGSTYPSVMITTLDLSKNYAGILMALTNGITALAGIVSPYIIGVLTPNQTLGEWRMVFWILFIVSVLSNVVFLVFGSGEVQYWDDPDFVNAEREKKRMWYQAINVREMNTEQV